MFREIIDKCIHLIYSEYYKHENYKYDINYINDYEFSVCMFEDEDEANLSKPFATIYGSLRFNNISMWVLRGTDEIVSIFNFTRYEDDKLSLLLMRKPNEEFYYEIDYRNSDLLITSKSRNIKPKYREQLSALIYHYMHGSLSKEEMITTMRGLTLIKEIRKNEIH